MGRVTETEAGHFLQEEVPVEIAAALLRIVDQIRLSKSGDTSEVPALSRGATQD